MMLIRGFKSVGYACLICLLPQLVWADGQLTALEQEQVQATLEQAYQLLKRNDCDEAKRILDESIRTLHSAEVELALVHAMMQAGQYQQALALAAHVQAEHAKYLEINLLYVWLLAMGGHEKSALNLLDERISSGEFPEAEAVQLAKMKTMMVSHRLFAADGDIVQEVLHQHLGIDKHYNPYRPVSLPIEGQWQGSGLLSADGQYVLVVQQDTEDSAQRIKSKDQYQIYVHQHGLLSAKWHRSLGGGMDLLVLEHPVHKAPVFGQSTGASKPGQPVYVVGTSFANAQPTWPLLQTDILGNAKQITAVGKQGINVFRLHLKNPAAGATVYNRVGQVLGLCMRDQHGDSWMLPIPADWTEGLAKSQSVADSGAERAADDIYESGFTRQVLVYRQPTEKNLIQ